MAENVIKDAIDNNKVAIFSKTTCPHCFKAKKLLRELVPQQDLAILELDERDDGSAIQNELYNKTNQSTVPNIFINQQHIGGNSDLQALNASGELAKRLGV